MDVVERHEADADGDGAFDPVHAEAFEEGAPALGRPDEADGGEDARVDVKRVGYAYNRQSHCHSTS